MSIVASVPTSFEGPFGKILYKIRAFIDTPRFSKDYKTQRPFYLLNVLNLNELPDIEVRLHQHLLISYAPNKIRYYENNIYTHILQYNIALSWHKLFKYIFFNILTYQFLSSLVFPATQLCCDNKKVYLSPGKNRHAHAEGLQ